MSEAACIETTRSSASNLILRGTEFCVFICSHALFLVFHYYLKHALTAHDSLSRAGVDLLCSIIVFGGISNDLMVSENSPFSVVFHFSSLQGGRGGWFCFYYSNAGDGSTCTYGVFVGVISAMADVCFILVIYHRVRFRSHFPTFCDV